MHSCTSCKHQSELKQHPNKFQQINNIKAPFQQVERIQSISKIITPFKHLDTCCKRTKHAGHAEPLNNTDKTNRTNNNVSTITPTPTQDKAYNKHPKTTQKANLQPVQPKRNGASCCCAFVGSPFAWQAGCLVGWLAGLLVGTFLP